MSEGKQGEPIREPATITRGDRKSLTGKQVHAIVVRRLRRIERLNFLESFAMFMGKAQLVELGLKNILTGKYGYDEERIESWSLGRVVKALRESGVSQKLSGLKSLSRGQYLVEQAIVVHDFLVGGKVDANDGRASTSPQR
jgi:hypothetical protein